MASENQIEKAVAALFQDIRFPHEPRGLYDPLRYMIEIGGKRIRPTLCLTAYSLYKEGFPQEVLQCAAALEVFHSFTLIHDDIMDRSPLRRGKSTVWTKWGEDGAILSGDVMCIDAYRRLASAPAEALPQVLDLFSTTAAQVCEGQQYDMEFENVDSVSMQDYMKMIGLKTAVLLACSAKMGALVAGAPQEDAEALYRYGHALGLAFQVADDYLDTYGDEKVFGKPIGGDIINNKKTWLLTKAMELTQDKGRLKEIMALPVETKEQKVAKIMFMKSEFNKLEIPQAATAQVRLLSDQAVQEVASLPDPDILRNFAEKLVGRAK
ncbi:MAG: polyprenyl synthetase family protein [Bacteroidales bacterium]|nr:polyprenyl synthetase family protein [Bacteroidales bacterium]